MKQDDVCLELYVSHRRALLTYANRIVRDPGRAEDVVQEAFLRLRTAAAANLLDEPVAYLYRIVRNLALDLQRHLTFEGRHEVAGAHELAAKVAEARRGRRPAARLNGRARFRDEASGIVRQPRLGHAGDVASLGAMAEEAKRLWGGSAAGLVIVWHPGDAAGHVQLRRSNDDVVAFPAGEIFFDSATGKLLPPREPLPVASAQHFIAGLHLIHFRHWTLRWLYFALGLSGCVLIATGCLFWLESRRKRHAQLGFSGVRIVEGLTIGSVSGIMIATLCFFVVNRLLPFGTTFAGYDRAALEIWTFYLVWLATFGHAWWRPRRAWIEQCWALAALAVAAVLLNWLTTGDHLLRGLAHRHLWAIAGMDLLLLVGAAVAATTSIRLQRRSKALPYFAGPDT